MRNLLMAKRIKEITLIFVAIQPTKQTAFAIDIRATHVVAGRNIIGTQVFGGKFEEGFKFNFFIAQNIRVRRATGFIFFKEQFEYVVPVFYGSNKGRYC